MEKKEKLCKTWNRPGRRTSLQRYHFQPIHSASVTSYSVSKCPVRFVVPSQESVQPVPSPQANLAEITHIGKLIVIKGDISGSGDVYWDGELEGSVELLGGSLTVGSGGRTRANLQAPTIVVQGRVDGNLYGLERAELKKSANVVGDISTPRIAIEDGASLRGNVRVHKDI